MAFTARDTSTPHYQLEERVKTLEKCAKFLPDEDAAVVKQAIDDMRHGFLNGYGDYGETAWYPWSENKLCLQVATSLLETAILLTDRMSYFKTFEHFESPSRADLLIRDGIVSRTTAFSELLLNKDGANIPVSRLINPDAHGQLIRVRNTCVHDYGRRVDIEMSEEPRYNARRHYCWLVNELPKMLAPLRWLVGDYIRFMHASNAYEIAHWNEEFRVAAELAEQERVRAAIHAEDERRAGLPCECEPFWDCKCYAGLYDGLRQDASRDSSPTACASEEIGASDSGYESTDNGPDTAVEGDTVDLWSIPADGASVASETSVSSDDVCAAEAIKLEAHNAPTSLLSAKAKTLPPLPHPTTVAHGHLGSAPHTRKLARYMTSACTSPIPSSADSSHPRDKNAEHAQALRAYSRRQAMLWLYLR